MKCIIAITALSSKSKITHGVFGFPSCIQNDNSRNAPK